MTKRIPRRKGVAALTVAACMAVTISAGCAQQAHQPEPDTNQAPVAQEPIDVAEAEEITGISADDEGIKYETGKLMVIFWPENTVEDLEATLAQAPSVQEKEITKEMLYDGTMSGGKLHRDTLEGPTIMVHTADGCSVVQAMAELERCDLVLSTGVLEIGVLDGWDTPGS